MAEITRFPGAPDVPVLPSADELAGLSDDALTDAVTTWAGRVAAGQARLLAYLGELDRRDAWAAVGVLSCAHWLSWRIGMSLTTAREKVRVARALRTLPATAAAFAAGRLSWSQVRAITRTATATDEARYVELARSCSGAQIERLTRAVARARTADERERDPDADRMRSTVRYAEDGTVTLTLRIPPEVATVVLAAIETARLRLEDAAAASDTPAAEDTAVPEDTGDGDGHSDVPACGQNPPAGAPPARPRVTVADTLVDLLTRPLDAPGAARRVRDLLTVHLDPLSGWARLPDGELLPPPATRALLARHDQGRNARQASPALKALLATVDGQRCRYPGCTRRRRMHAHHVTHWTDGGPTDLANLILLCSRHHRHVHDSGTRLALHPDRRLDISTADGQPIPHRPAPPWRPATELDPHVRPDTLPPTVIDSRLDLHYAVAVLMQQAA